MKIKKQYIDCSLKCICERSEESTSNSEFWILNSELQCNSNRSQSPFASCHSERSEESTSNSGFFTSLRSVQNDKSARYQRLLKLIIITIIILAFYHSESCADNTNKFSYFRKDFHEGGEIVIAKPSIEEQQPLLYFIKPNWAGESEVIYSWRGLSRINARGSIRDVFVLASEPLESSLLAVWKENSRIFVAHLDSLTNIISIVELFGDWQDYGTDEAKWLGRVSPDNYLILVNGHLFLTSLDNSGRLTVRSISKDVLAAVPLYSPDDYKTKNNFAYVTGKEGWAVVYFSDLTKEDEPAAHLQIPEEIYIQPAGNKIAIISNAKSSSNSLLQIISGDKGIINSFWVESKGGLIKIVDNGESKIICYLKNNGNKYSFVSFDLQDYNNRSKWNENAITSNFIEPLNLWQNGDIIYIAFRNGLASFNIDGKILSSDFFALGEYFTAPPELTAYSKYVIMSSPTASIIFEKKENTFWFINLFLRTSGKILIPLILFLLLISLYQLFRRQKRLLNAVLDLPSSGFVFIIDKNGRLLRANDSGKKLLGITNLVPLKKMFQYYAVLEETKSLKELVNKAIMLKDSISQKINILQEGNTKEWYCTVVPLKNIAGQYRGMVFTGIDITEELEKKRLSNWAQLGHDMQTNLSTIRLNAEQMQLEKENGNLDRRKKIVHQANLLIQRVRDIVTVGRSDGLELQTVNAASICLEARIEFDESLFPNVEFELKVLNFNLACDKAKMVRALRNAIENSIKALNNEPGLIKIACWSDSRNAFFSVKDTGSGMDEKTREKILTPYFTTSKAQGGTGIGTMIMQHVVQLHGGELNINSVKSKGTEVIFSIPIYLHSRKNNNS